MVLQYLTRQPRTYFMVFRPAFERRNEDMVKALGRYCWPLSKFRLGCETPEERT